MTVPPFSGRGLRKKVRASPELEILALLIAVEGVERCLHDTPYRKVVKEFLAEIFNQEKNRDPIALIMI